MIGFFNSQADHRIEAFDVQTERGDAIVLDQAERYFGKSCLRLVARGHQKCDRQASLLHRHAESDGGRLCDDGDATAALAQPDIAVLVGPQKRAVSIVDQTIAVRADNRHLGGGGDELDLQPLAVLVIGFGFAEAGSIPGGAAGAAFCQRLDHINGEVAADTDPGSVRSIGQFCHRAVVLRPATLLGCTGQISPVKPILIDCATTAAACRPPNTAIVIGHRSRFSLCTDQAPWGHRTAPQIMLCRISGVLHLT